MYRSREHPPENVTLISPAKTLMQLQNSRGITLDNIHYADNTDLLMHISGNRSNGIKLLNTNTSHAKKTAETSANVPANVLTMN